MIINKIEPFWTEEDRREFSEWDSLSADTHYDMIMHGKTDGIKEQEAKVEKGKDAVRARVAARYLKARTRRGVLADAKEILAAVEKKDYQDTLVDMKKLVPLLEKIGDEESERLLGLFNAFIEENYTNCCGFLSSIVGANLDILKGTPQYETVRNWIADKAAKWYPRTTFSTIRQSTSTNALTKLRAIMESYDEDGNKTGNTAIDPVTGEATITSGSLIIRIPKYGELAGLRTSTYQLLDAIVLALTESGAKSPTVYLTVEDYMSKRDLKDRKNARQQLTDDLAVILGINITEIENESGKSTPLPLAGVAMSDSWKWADKKKTIVEYTFGSTFYKALLGYPVMPYPNQLQTIKSKSNPNGYYLLRRIAEHKNMNVGKDNEDLISVQTLLEAAPYIPSYAEVMKKGRDLSRQIIEAFERDMDALEETLTWEYCHSKGAPLTPEELDKMNYSIFKDLLVKITWKAYPDQTARLAKKEERKANAGRKKAAKTPKKSKKDGSGS